MIPSKLEYRFALLGVLLTCVVGGIIGFVGYRQMTASVRGEAMARVAEANRAGQRLFEAQFESLDPDNPLLAEAKLTRYPASNIDPEIPLHPLLQASLNNQKTDGFVLLPEGLSMVSARHLPDTDAIIVATLPLRGANWLPDQIRAVVFGASDEEQNPTTVTIFEKGTRIATNVRLADGSRAIGTQVSDEVDQRVLQEGHPWNDRAFVVNRWVISSYLPIRDVGGDVLGMLYAGIDESVYVTQQEHSIFLFILFILGLTLVMSVSGWQLGRRLASPITKLTGASSALSRGDREQIDVAAGDPEEIRTLAMAFNHMAEEVSAKTIALEESNRQVQKALDDYMEVLGFVAHELKSPVAGVLTQLDMIDGGFVGEVPEKLQQPMAAIRRYMNYGHEMALSFNNLSRMESEGFAPHKSRVSDLCEEVVSPAMADLSSQAALREMTIILKGADVPGWVDLDLMRVVMDNLIGNAVKYGREGTKIQVAAERMAQGIRVAIRNQGVGVPPDRQEELFRKFRRIHDPNLKPRKGTGVGLYLVKKIVELHGGRVGIDGVYGEWIEFWVEIPDGDSEV
jgi:signal transduction histidine kinase